MQLVYRGSSFSFQPMAIARCQAAVITTHQLIYRGIGCTYQKPVDATPAAPKAINWRVAQVCQTSDRLFPAHA